jgi:hypothetical protein
MHGITTIDPTKIGLRQNTKATASSATPVIWTAFVIALMAAIGSVFGLWLRTQWVGIPDPRNWFNAFYVVFARGEPLGLLTVAIFYVGIALFFIPKRRFEKPPALQVATLGKVRLRLMVIAAIVFAIAVIGTTLVCHDYALSADEYMADFQARIFLRGKITAEVPAEWLTVVRTIKPTFADYLPATHSWKSAYLPVYAAMRAVFQSISLQSFLNPLLDAVSVVALFGAARNIWPTREQNAFVAVGLLATSSQFLAMAMTSYSMPAHLALNAIWLWLYSAPDRRRFYIAPFVGVLAIGLHQPIVHALFVAPFLLRIALKRRWRDVLIFGLVYVAGCAGWFAWRVHYSPPSALPTASFFRLLNPSMLVVQPMDLLLVIGWSSLATPLLAALGLRRIFQERPIVQDAAVSCLLTFGFYVFFYLDQGNGWGYRYFHGTLACLILVAVAGWESLVKLLGALRAKQFLVAGITASLAIQLPLRCFQVEAYIRPFAQTSEVIRASKVEIVGINPLDAWYSADLVRNDPFLENRPIIVSLLMLRREDVDILSRREKAWIVTAENLSQFGLATKKEGRPSHLFSEDSDSRKP